MKKRIKPKEIKGYNVKIELAQTDKLFQSIAKDKSLPTFGSFFMHCLILGISEEVNLKRMYPKLHKKLGIWLETHNTKVFAWRLHEKRKNESKAGM